MPLIPLIVLSLLGAEQTLDDFQHASAPSAQQGWRAAEGTPAVQSLVDNGRSVLKLDAPFADRPKLQRVVIDRKLPIDLGSPGEFALEVLIDPPEAVHNLTLYFHSGKGWYGAGAPVGGKGWHTVRILKTAFRPEDSPAGWDRVDGARIAAWRGRAENAVIRLRRLAAVSHEIALLVPSQGAEHAGGEVRAAAQTAHRVASMLAELGLGADVLEESAISPQRLAGRRVVVLPYNPRLAEESIRALVQFVEGGGKIVACYHLPARLGAAIGFGPGKYVSQERPGHFAEMRLEDAGIRGLPKSVRQASWNITAFQPIGHQARIVGRWYDDAGQPTGQPAVLVSDRGAVVTHILLSDDPAAKRGLLAAILGSFHDSFWQQIAQSAVDRAGRVGHCTDVEDLGRFVRDATDRGAAAEKSRAAGDPFREALTTLQAAKDRLAERDYPAAAELARGAHRGFVEAYLRCQPSPAREGRAVWNHSGMGAYPGDWDRSARLLAANGFNMVFPNMLWAGLAHYRSALLPQSATFREHGDQVQQCCEAAKKHGLEVHVWKVNFNLSGAPKEFVDRMRAEGRTQVSASGKPQDWLCPSHTENHKLECDSMLEVARNYPVDGLHFDYIRYPGRECCYCDGCRARFEADSGRKVAAWPAECFSGSRREEYNAWRCRQITSLVQAVRHQSKQVRPGLKISAAVFGSYPDCRESIAQDWPQWVQEGLLDFVCPMDYTESEPHFGALVENQLKLVAGRIPLYPGIGATASSSGLSADRVVAQIRRARSVGAHGFTVFNFDRGTAESLIPGIGLGAGARTAAPVHGR